MKTLNNTVVEVRICTDSLYRVYENEISTSDIGYSTKLLAFEEYFHYVQENYKREKHRKFLPIDCDAQFYLFLKDFKVSLMDLPKQSD